MALSKRRLGVGYLVGTGAFLGAILLARLLVGPLGSADLLGTGTGLGASLALGYAGYWLRGSPLGDGRVWRVAMWGTAGISAVTLLAVAVVAAPRRVPGTDVLISNVAAGGLAGVLVGGIRELNRELDRTARLNEQNAVLNRVLRHNVRNDMNVVIGMADVLASRFGDPSELEEIRERARNLTGLAAKARRAEAAIESAPAGGPVDVAAVVERRAALVEDAHPGATVSVDRPGEAPAAAGDAADVIARNLLENAVERAESPTPTVRATVRRRPAGVELRVTNDGVPPAERRALEGGAESPLEHASGMELWLVKWLVDRHDGDLGFEAGPDGTVVRVRLPSAEGGVPDTGNAFPVGQSVWPWPSKE